MIARFVIINGALGASLFAAIIAGWVWPLVETDRTYMTGAIAALFAIGLALVILRQWHWVEWIRQVLPGLGLLGTFIGFSIAVGGVEGGDYDLRNLGVATALNTTIVGLIGNLWLHLNERALR